MSVFIRECVITGASDFQSEQMRGDCRIAIVNSVPVPTSDCEVPYLSVDAATDAPYSLANTLMRWARQPALNPLLMLTTPTPEAHELSMVKRGAIPPKLAP